MGLKRQSKSKKEYKKNKDAELYFISQSPANIFKRVIEKVETAETPERAEHSHRGEFARCKRKR